MPGTDFSQELWISGPRIQIQILTEKLWSGTLKKCFILAYWETGVELDMSLLHSSQHWTDTYVAIEDFLLLFALADFD